MGLINDFNSEQTERMILMGKGQNVKNQNVESTKKNIKSLKVDQKFEKDQNVESLFLKWSERQKWRAWSERQKSERRKECWKSKMTLNVLILPMASKKIRMSKIKKSTTYGVFPMFTKACGGWG
jgi:hypothetical protein